jgi:hypothetical protein
MTIPQAIEQLFLLENRRKQMGNLFKEYVS